VSCRPDYRNIVRRFNEDNGASYTSRAMVLQKIPQSCDFDYLFGGQHGRNDLRLRSSVYLVEMTLGRWLREERSDAFVQSAINNQIGAGRRGRFCAFVPNRRPFLKCRRGTEINVVVVRRAGPCSRPACRARYLCRSFRSSNHLAANQSLTALAPGGCA
jgi:hypothetical protein